jgi:hypothetical protein
MRTLKGKFLVMGNQGGRWWVRSSPLDSQSEAESLAISLRESTPRYTKHVRYLVVEIKSEV